MGKPAARVTDNVVHPTPPILTGIGSINVFIGKLPAWRGVSPAAAAALLSAKTATDTANQAAEAATKAAGGTPAAPVAKAAEIATKAASAATMATAIASSAGLADKHACVLHGVGVVINGSQTVLINGLPACRMRDSILEVRGPFNKIVRGCPTVFIGG